MNAQLTAYVALICTSGVLNISLFAFVYRNRHHYKSIANYFMLYTIAITIYCFGSAMSLTATTIGQMKFWTVIQYVGMPISTPLGLLFVMKYLGIPVSRKKALSLLLIPIITLGMVATNNWHHLHYRVYEFHPVLGAPYVLQENGSWYTIHGVYIFTCMFAAFLLAIFQWKETTAIYRQQLLSLILGQAVPIVTAFIYLLGLTPPGVDPVPVVMWLSSLLYLWSIRSSRLFRLMPVAKDAIFNSINDGVIVLDESNRLIEFNRICKAYFPQLDQKMIGKDFHHIWQAVSGSPLPLAVELVDQVQEIHFAAGPMERVYQIRSSPLMQTGKPTGLLLILTDITAMKRMQSELQYQASYDGLTQIYNRRAFLEHCEKDLATASGQCGSAAVMLLDVDHFKNVNDTYGHHLGDQLLKHVVSVCRDQLTDGHIFARYGGEEFALYLSGHTAVEAQKIGNELRESLEQHAFHSHEGMIPVTMSMGVAAATAGSEETIDQLLNKADKALYAAKQAGRNQVQVYLEEVSS